MHMPMPVGWITQGKAPDARSEGIAERQARLQLSEAARSALAMLLAQAPPAPQGGVAGQSRTAQRRTGEWPTAQRQAGSNESSC